MSSPAKRRAIAAPGTRLSWVPATSMRCRRRSPPDSVQRAQCMAAPSRRSFMSAALLEHEAALGAEELACGLRQRFEDYNEEFTRITRRASRHFMGRDWHAARADAVQRIELYERHVSAAIAVVRRGDRSGDRRSDAVDRDKAALCAADRRRPGQRLLPDFPEFDHTRRVRHGRRRRADRVHGYGVGPRLGQRTHSRASGRGLVATGGMRGARRICPSPD